MPYRAAEIAGPTAAWTVLGLWTAELSTLCIGHAGAACAAAFVPAAIDATCTAIAGNLAKLTRIWATELFTVAVADAAGVIATLAMRCANSARVAAVWSALGESGRTDAFAAADDLLSGAFDRFRRGGGSNGGIRLLFEDGAANHHGATKSQQSLEHGPAARPRGYRFDERVERTVIHRCPPRT